MYCFAVHVGDCDVLLCNILQSPARLNGLNVQFSRDF